MNYNNKDTKNFVLTSLKLANFNIFHACTAWLWACSHLLVLFWNKDSQNILNFYNYKIFLLKHICQICNFFTPWYSYKVQILITEFLMISGGKACDNFWLMRLWGAPSQSKCHILLSNLVNHTSHPLLLEQQNLYYLEFAFDDSGKLCGWQGIFVFCKRLYTQTFSNVWYPWITLILLMYNLNLKYMQLVVGLSLYMFHYPC